TYPSQPGIICAYGSSSGYHCGNLVALNKVDLGTNGFESEGDLGGPVDPNHKLVYYTPLGISLAAIFGNDDFNKQGVNGLLTSAQCCVNNNCLNGNIFDSAYENEDDGNLTKIGQVHDAQFGGASGLDYAFVSLDSVDWSPFNYTAGLTAHDNINHGTITELYPVTSDFTPTEPGLKVCAFGQGSGYLCVDLGTEGMVSQEDLGGPVYAQSNNSGTTTAQALGHIVATNNDDPNHKFLYYLPIDKEGSSRCITGFAVKKKGFIYDSPGILTAAHCFINSNNGKLETGVNVFVGDKDIGYNDMAKYGDKDGNDYAFIDTAITSVVTPEIGTEACGFVEEIGLACGKIINRDMQIWGKNPGTNELSIKKGLYVIDIEKKSFKKEAFGPGSSGAPIFVRTSGTTVQALGIIAAGDDDGEKITVYVMPLSKIFSDSKLKLVTTKDCKSKSVQIREKQEAKIEIPPK
ncbi:9120_t:CDS:2, partial [Ambispora gerdemannii]